MSQLKVNTIRHTSATSDAITLANDGTATAKITNQPPGNRNLVINGAFQVAQRGTSSTTSGWGTVDRWKHYNSVPDEAVTSTQHALTSSDTGPWEKGFRYSAHMQNGNQSSGAFGANEVYFYYQFESQDISQSGWDYTSTSSYITLSFWVKSSVAQNFYGNLVSRDGTHQAYPFETGSLSANTWTKITKTIPGNSNIQIDNDNGQGLSLAIYAFNGTNYTDSGVTLNQWSTKDNAAAVPVMTTTWFTTNDATFEITGVQLEVGDVATDFEHRSYRDELARCQRYFWQVTKKGSTADVTNKPVAVGHYMSSSEIRCIFDFPVTMRAQPTHSSNDTNNSWYFNGAGTGDTFDRFDMYSATEQRAILRNAAHVSGTAGVGGMAYQETGDSTLSFSAEL